MHSVQTGLWDPRPPSKHASPLPQPPPSYTRLAHVTTAAPAKRITFYKSGDSQFGGIRMAVHKRSFKCFDALLDDLSQKVPLPFGVRTVTTPRGTHTIRHLEQLQDGGCYLCSDRRQAKPINMELVNKRPSVWYHQGRRPQRPDASSVTPPGHLPYRQRRILLVKNSEPGLRRSMVLSRRSTRSLRAFLDEVSELMQFHVRKLYTVEGRRIDSAQSLMTCPGVLVCVGREAFSPMLVNFLRKSSDEKLPGLGSRSPGLGPRTPGNGARSPATQGARSPPHGAQSRASEYSEGHESKKNVNFGLETKKSIIHPRSDSSNRSGRYSLSSEKSYGNGVSTYSQSKPSIMNEDIEKRVLVNKDGSLSVEMRVRFRLHNEETLQWSTQIKKSPSLTNDSYPLSQAQTHYLQQGQSESCSDPDSATFDPEGVDYASQPLQCVSEAIHCPCCYQRQEQHYDLWENPAHTHKHHPVPPPHAPGHAHTMMRHTHSSSSSSSCNSRRVVRCRARLSNCGEDSGSEQSQLVQEEVCMTEQVERRVEVEQGGDTHVEVCRVSRCCSRSEVIAVDNGGLRPLKSAEDELVEEGGERPLSAISSSSHILQSLKEDQDDELPPSASRCCHSNDPCQSPTSDTHPSDKPSSNAGSARSIKHEPHEEEEERGSRAVSAASTCHCGAATPHSVAEAEELERTPTSNHRTSRASCRSSKSKIPTSEEEGADDEDEEIKRVFSGLSGHTGSQHSRASSMCPNCGGCKRGLSSLSNSRASQRSRNSLRASPKPATPLHQQGSAHNGSDDDGSDASAVSTQSNKSNLTNHGRVSATSNVLEERASSAMSADPEATGKEEERAPSAASAASRRSGCNSRASPVAEKAEGRSPSAMSARSNLSVKSRKSHKSHSNSKAGSPDIKTREEAEGGNVEERALSSLSVKSAASSKVNVKENAEVEEDETNQRTPSALSVKSDKPTKAERPDSVLSAKSALSHRSTCSQCARTVSPGAKATDELVTDATGQEEGKEATERAASAMSSKSNLSAKSNKSHKSTKASERSLSPRSEAGGDLEKRAMSQMSGKSVQSRTSAKSCKSCKGKGPVDEETQKAEIVMSDKLDHEERAASAASSKSRKSNCKEAISETGDNTQDDDKERAASALSAKSHHTNCDGGSRVASPAVDTDANSTEKRTGSAMSGKSHVSSKSLKSNHTTASPSPNDGPTIESNGEEMRVASAMSVKSKSSVRSGTSHKSASSKNLKSVSPNANVVTIKTPEEIDDDTNDATERAPSAASVQSGKSQVSSALSHKSSRTGAADAAVTEATDADAESPRSKSSDLQTLSPRRTRSQRTNSPKAPATPPSSPQSPVQQLLPGPGAGETRGPSALSVRSGTSAKSGRSKCRCEVTSALEKAKKEKEEEKENTEEVKTEEKAASIISSSSKKHRRGSGGTEEALSRNSSGSVSLGLPEDQEAADSDSGKSGVSFHKTTERKSQASSKTNQGSVTSVKSSKKIALSHNPPAIEIPTIETPDGDERGKQKTERAVSALSAKSSKSHKSSCKCSVSAAALKPSSNSPNEAGNDLETGSSTPANNADAPDNRNSSAMSSVSAKSRKKSPTGASTGNENQSRPASKAEEKEDKAESVHSKSPSTLRPESAASAHSEPHQRAKSSSSAKASSSQKKEAALKSSSPCPHHSSRPCSKAETCSESTLSHSLSAADLLKETMAAARPRSQQSKASEKPRSEKSGRSHKSKKQAEREELELTPACLPNASPNEVVSDWLRSIPANSNMLALGDEAHEGEEEEKAEEEDEKEKEARAEDEKAAEEAEEEGEKVEETEGDVAEKEEEEKSDAVGASSRPKSLLLSDQSLPRNWHSSAAVMKVLLSPSLGRCRSLPEVSPVYGRRLSTSARGFLDCLAQLQLIEPAVTPGCDNPKDQRYEDIMAILQSLWLTEPGDIDAKVVKDIIAEQVTPPRSSSGVDMSSGSGGSGKENETNQNKTTEAESLHEEVGAEKVVEEEKGGVEDGEAEAEETPCEQAQTDTPEELAQNEEQSSVPPSLDSPKATENPSSSDKSSANDSSKSPTDNERETQEDSSSGTPPTVIRAPLSKKLSQDPDPVWILHLLKKLEKQFMNHYITAMAEFKVRWDLDDSVILDTMITELREEVSRRIQSSIEREMKKIQSRAGRAGRTPQPPRGGNLSRESTMTERRRQMLRVMKNQSVKTADTLSDEDMTGEFSDQRSDDEYCPCDACVRKKMAARPLKMNPPAAEAPVMMEFDLLKILQLKKTPSPSAVPPPAEEESDSVALEEEARNLEVVQEVEEEEEEDETKEDIKADVVLEETIPEEDEEVDGEDEEQGEEEKEESSAGDEEQEEEATGNGEEEEEEVKCQCQCEKTESEEEEEEEGDAAEGENAEEETSDNTGEGETADEEERSGEEGGEEAEDEEQTEDNEGETATGEEESEEETVREAKGGEEETAEKGEAEEEEADGEAEGCEVMEFKVEEEETNGRESAEEEEASGETDAKEESTLVEEFGEGNVSASAEGGDEDDGTGGDEDVGGEESEEQEKEEGERTSPQGVTEGEEADVEDSDTDGKRPSDTSADESGHEAAVTTGDEQAEDVVEEFKPEEEEVEEEEVSGNKKEDGALLYQFTRTSVESQPGSLEDIDPDSSPNPVNSIEVPKMAVAMSSGGGAGQRRSRSPARVKRRKPKESDVEMDDI